MKRIISYPNSTQETPVNTYLKKDGSFHYFTGSTLLARLRRTAQSLGPDILGFHHKQIGLHSAQSGAAMAMYLSAVPVFTIMLLGRWSSDAFLRYIRKQVQEFSSEVSSKMIQKEEFFIVPTDSTNTTKSSNHPTQNAQRNKNGLSFRDAIQPLIEVFQ